MSKFQRHTITSNHFTACCVSSDSTHVLRILLYSNIQLRQLSSWNNIWARHVVTLWTSNHVHCLCIQVQT